ncbi:MAG: adenylate/guanylate cyclase domain-containing protein [Alphaproteobacteria bacterium]|nr:adenylate/guanylate cyclase domain-containing protein [Alphaproteobacteria bacterium]
MAGGRSVSYEVYYLQYGRWQIHHRYNYSERDIAIDEAKRLDSQGHFDAACVVRESWDEASGTASESVIYHSPKLKTKPPVAFITAGNDGTAKPSTAGASGPSGGGRGSVKNAPPGSAAANAAAEARKKAAARKAQQKKAPAKEPDLRRPPKRGEKGADDADWAAAIPKMIIAFLFACVTGTIAGVLAYYGIKLLSSVGIAFGLQINQFVLIGSWFVGWAMTFFPLLRKILSGIRPMARAAPVRPSIDQQLAEQRRRQSEAASKALADAASTLDALASKPDEAMPPAANEETAEEGATGGENEGDTGADEAGANDSVDQEEGATSGEAEERPETRSTSEPMEEVGPAPLRAALAELVDEAKRLSNNTLDKDHFLRFGVILFLAGAAETLARRFKVAAREVTTILSEQIETLGVSASMALGFAANIDEYLLDKRYFEMYAAGRGGALSQGGDSRSDSGMAAAFRLWKTPKAPPGQDVNAQDDPKHYDNAPGDQEHYGFVAVLFTDIVGSTQKQQTNGDAWLMNVVRAHNDIVREAISKHGGREIKHTGDGIMASFPAVIASVEAALAMQDGIQKFSEMMPDLAFEICVGISAGEPIHESGDLFGTPVNLAARVLSKASAHETAVSSIVREMCRGKSFIFEEIGRFDLKGFEEPQPIFRVKDRRKKARGTDASEKAVAASS